VRDVDERARNLRKKQDHGYNSNKEDTMNEQEIADKVKTLVANRLGTPVEQIALETRFSEDLNADSLDIVDLIMALEEAFQVKIPDNEAQQIKTVGDTVAFLLSHLSQSA
jgi:acyl carrier protein